MIIQKLLNEFDEDVIRAFVQKNADYYLNKWKLMAGTNSITSWNWASFSFLGFWMGYRKMYFYYAIYHVANFLIFIAGSIFIPLLYSLSFTANSFSFENSRETFAFAVIIYILLITIGNFVLLGLFGNYIYGIYTYKKLKKFSLITKDKENLKLIALSKGGISWLGALIVILLGVALNIVIEIILGLIMIIISAGISAVNSWQ